MKKIKKFLSTNTTIDGPRFESIVRSIRHVLLFIVFLSSLSLSILNTVDCQQDAKIKVEIFYETANHNVQKFMAQQFRPMIEYINLTNIHLELYPYGQTVEQNGTYECPYGDIQCLANKYQKISIQTCRIGGKLKSKKDFEKGLAIFINDKHDPEARKDFIKQICSLLPNVDECKNPPTTIPVAVTVYYEALNPISYNYFHQQLCPYYHVLDDIIELELIPFGNTIIIDDTNMITNSSSGKKRQDFSNRFQALVVDRYINNEHNGDLISGPNRVLNFLDCLIGKKIGNEYDHLEECTNVKLNNEYIEFLEEIKMNGEKMQKIFRDFSTRTKKIMNTANSENLPLITVNDNDKINVNAFNDLVQEVCDKFNSPKKPAICTKVPMTIFYEASHQPSRRFFLDHLRPIFQNLYNLIDFSFKPTGRAKSNNNSITCPGGPDQCEMMKIHACAIDHYWNDGANFTDHNRQHVFDFIWCTMKNIRSIEKPYDLGEICANKYLDGFEQWLNIDLCAKSEESIVLLTQWIAETHSSGIENISLVPIVIFNHATNNQQILLDNEQVKKEICNHFDDYHQPDYCTMDESNPVNVDVYYDSNNELAKHFFITQLNHTHVFIEEIANVFLHPIGNTENLVDATNGNCHDSNSSICLANAIHASVIDKYESPNQLDIIDERLRITNFIACFVSHPQWPNNVQLIGDECAKSQLNGDKLPEINGESLKKALEKTTELKKKLSKTEITIPWITLNNNVENNHEAIEDLLQAVCTKYNGHKPDECSTATVDIYYSSYASDSRKFFIEQLIPTFRHIRERIRLNLYPYGPADKNKTVEDECENDAERCEANKIHACVLNRYWNQEELVDSQTALWDSKNQTLSFIHCFFKKIGNDITLTELMQQCENEFLPIADQINSCVMNETESLGYLRNIRQKTIDVVGTMTDNIAVIVNGEQMSLAESNLQTSICNELLGEKPLACHRDKPSKVQIQFHYSAFDFEVANFIKINKFYENYFHLEEIADIQIIPYGKSSIDDHKLNCPGEVECLATRIHACVVDTFSNNSTHAAIDGQLQVIKFIDCYFSKFVPNLDFASIAEGCVESIFHTDSWSSILNCAKSNQSIDSLKEYNDKFVSKLLPKIAYVPWITIQNHHSYDAENHFIRTICDSYDGLEKPSECYQKFTDKPSIVVFYEAKNPRSRNVFITQFDRNRTKIDTSISTLLPIPIYHLDIDNKTECINDVECLQTFQHGCIIFYHQNQMEKLIDFLNCHFGQKFTEINSTETCFNEIFDESSWNIIEECVNNMKEILKKNMKILINIYKPVASLPFIQIDGVIKEDELNLMTHICSMYYSDDKPKQCQLDRKSIGIFYQTLEKSVEKFATKQLSYQSEYLDEFGEFNFYPYGKTVRKNDGYECPSGNQQCSENKIHACILDKYYNNSKFFDTMRIKSANFLVCSLDESVETDNSTLIQSCFNQYFSGESWNHIVECSNGSRGEELYDELAIKTESGNFGDKLLPWITLNKQYSEKAVKNLFATICDDYGLIKNPRCSSISNAMATDLRIYFSCDQSGRDFIINNLKPFYSYLSMNKHQKEETSLFDEVENQLKLKSLLKITLVPYGNTIDNNDSFSCPSDEECFANRYIACANHYHSSEFDGYSHLVEFTLCFFNHGNYSNNIVFAAQQCSYQTWYYYSYDLYKALNICADSNETSYLDIFREMKHQTESIQPKLDHFPSITIGTKVETETNIMKIACTSYNGIDYPRECDQYLDDKSDSDSKPFPIWAIILIVIAVLIVIGLLFVCIRRNR
ncbi:hypothetical protein HUG17_2186 [Dermatophagoides farinae]|uniref:Uncharacterized protein n=1 Tax=Dermatophagoides farinae TaxID=6954 RepID=A0A9D4PA67_DERFA|nr:hypothetical protein HUG17_2186 [Dermatophagoides farinae]